MLKASTSYVTTGTAEKYIKYGKAALVAQHKMTFHLGSGSFDSPFSSAQLSPKIRSGLKNGSKMLNRRLRSVMSKCHVVTLVPVRWYSM